VLIGAAATLTRLDPGLSRELRAAGRAAWQVLGGAAGDDRFASGLLAAEALWRRSSRGEPAQVSGGPASGLIALAVRQVLQLPPGFIDLVGVLAAGLLIDLAADPVNASVHFVRVLSEHVLDLVNDRHFFPRWSYQDV
jgi:hypothetical protein